MDRMFFKKHIIELDEQNLFSERRFICCGQLL